MKRVEAFIACMGLALAAGCGESPSNVDVDKPTETKVDTPTEAKTDIAEQPTTERPQPPSIDIWTAASQGDIEAVKRHIAAGANIDATFVAPGIPGSGGTPLHIAVLADQTEVVKLLVENGANLNAKAKDEHGGTPLHWAAFFGRAEIAKGLIEGDADVNAKDDNGFTPLDATQNDPESEKEAKLEIAELLREKGGRSGNVMQAPAIDIWTAAGQGNIDAIEQHSAAGTDLNAKEPGGGSSPLFVASLFGQTEAARLLIEKGADLTIKNNHGSTALHVAAFFGHPETVKLLLEKGADVTAKNNNGETPLDTVAGDWNEELEGVYGLIAGALQIEVDLERIKGVRPQIAELLRKHGGESDN